MLNLRGFDTHRVANIISRQALCVEMGLSEEDGPSVDSTMPGEGMEEEACEVLNGRGGL